MREEDFWCAPVCCEWERGGSETAGRVEKGQSLSRHWGPEFPVGLVDAR